MPEVVSELLGVGVNSKKVQQEYLRLLDQLGPELPILLDLPPEEIAKVGGPKLAAGIVRMRRGQVNPVAGFDGEYGVIRLFADRPPMTRLCRSASSVGRRTRPRQRRPAPKWPAPHRHRRMTPRP